MSENTKIEWANHTGGPHFGCDPVSPGCANCYAWELAESRLEPLFRRAYKAAGFADWETRPVWGRNATRVLSKGFWKDARRINAQHAKAGTRGRWFPSMIDWLDEMPGGIITLEGEKLDPIAVLADFLKLIHDTPHLIWQLLTKRPENFQRRMALVSQYADAGLFSWIRAWTWSEENGGGQPPANVWVGTSVEDQKRADERIPELLKIPAAVRFLSLEPLLGPVDLGKATPALRNGFSLPADKWIDWLIIGGESGPGARPCNVDWIRDLVRQGKAAGVATFVKQLGSDPIMEPGPITWPCDHPKGGDPAEWPDDLRVREFPEVKP